MSTKLFYYFTIFIYYYFTVSTVSIVLLYSLWLKPSSRPVSVTPQLARASGGDQASMMVPPTLESTRPGFRL